jgi:alanine racemase
MSSVQRNTWLEIDVAQFRQNLTNLRPSTGAKMLLVVKANAYGHGLVRMAQEAVAHGVVMVGVGSINEAEQLLDAGLDAPILVITPLLANEIEFCVARGVHFMAWRRDHFVVAAEAQRATGKTAHIHVELDFGMARSGIDEKQFLELLTQLDDEALAMVYGLCAHYAFAAVVPDFSALEPYVEMFSRCAAALKERGVTPLRHVSNSAGTLRFPEWHFDMVRMGASAFGIVSTKLFDVASVAKPVASWKALVTNVRDLEAGQGVSYAWEYVAQEPHRIATIGVGYADGFHRHPAGINTVLIHGVETPVLGRVNMDQCVFRVPDDMDVNVGDEVVLLGKQGDAEIATATLAKRWGTNGYDALVGIRSRVPRKYIN